MRTSLYNQHLRLKAKIVDFHGWQMPISYRGIIEEHNTVRNQAGLFDLSHMGRIFIRGNEGIAFLQKLLPVDVEKVHLGQAKYTFVLNEQGNILDDLILYRDEIEILLVVNASNREKILAWVEKQKGMFPFKNVEIHDATFEYALIALQGPRSLEVMKDVFNLELANLRYYYFQVCTLSGIKTMVARTGYTGEDGFELFVPVSHAEKIWNAFLEGGRHFGIAPIGLGARDTLRTEAGMPLYGQEISEETNPLEANLAFAVSFDKADYVGLRALKQIQKDGPRRKLIGFQGIGKRIARHGMDCYHRDKKVGFITSGTFSPTFGKPIGMGYVSLEHTTPGTRLAIDIRGTREEAEVVVLPFYNRPRKKA